MTCACTRFCARVGRALNVCSRHGTSVALVLRDSAGDTQCTTACAVMAGRSLHRKSAPADAAAKKMSEAVSGKSAKNSEGKTPLELAHVP